MNIQFKYLITGIILCWTFVGFPIATELALWIFPLLVYLAILKIFLSLGLQRGLSLLVAIPCYMAVMLNSTLFIIYQDIYSEPAGININKEYIAYRNQPIQVITNTDYIYIFKSSKNILEYPSSTRKKCSDSTLKTEKCYYWVDSVKNLKGFIESNIEEGIPTLIVNKQKSWGVNSYSYKLLDDDKLVIATAHFKQRNFFPENIDGYVSNFGDKHISSVSYLLRENPFTQALKAKLATPPPISLDEFISKAFKFGKIKSATNTRYQKVDYLDLPMSFVTKEYSHLIRKTISEKTLAKPIEIKSLSQESMKDFISKLELQNNITFENCDNYLSPNPNSIKGVRKHYDHYVKFRGQDKNKVTISGNSDALCSPEKVLISKLTDIYPYPYLQLKYFNHHGQALKIFTYNLADDAIEKFAIPLYNTLKIGRDYFSISWVMTKKLENSYQKLLETEYSESFDFKSTQSNFGLPLVPLMDLPLEDIAISKVFTASYSSPKPVFSFLNRGNVAPIANADRISVPQNGILPLNKVLIENDQDEDNDTIKLRDVFNVHYGTIKKLNKDDFYYIAPSSIEYDTFKYSIFDYDNKLLRSVGGSDWNLVNIDVLKNSSPIAVDDEYSVQAGKQVILNVIENDVDHEDDYIFIDTISGLDSSYYQIKNNQVILNVPKRKAKNLNFQYVVKELNKKTGLKTTNTSTGNVKVNIVGI